MPLTQRHTASVSKRGQFEHILAVNTFTGDDQLPKKPPVFVAVDFEMMERTEIITEAGVARLDIDDIAIPSHWKHNVQTHPPHPHS